MLKKHDFRWKNAIFAKKFKKELQWKSIDESQKKKTTLIKNINPNHEKKSTSESEG